MKPCPVCGSNEIYQYEEYISDPSAWGGGTMLPGLGKTLWVAKVRPVVCQSCGNVRLFASEEARQKLPSSKQWQRVED